MPERAPRGWLREAAGEPVPVQPVLVLPGWYVERARRGDVLVLNGKQDCKCIATQRTDTTMPHHLTQRGSEVLEQVCRDVMPTAYKSQTREEESSEATTLPEMAITFSRITANLRNCATLRCVL